MSGSITDWGCGRVGKSVGLATGWSWVRILLVEHRFGSLAIPFTQICQFISEETLKSVGPSYLVSMPVEVKYPTQMCNLS